MKTPTIDPRAALAIDTVERKRLEAAVQAATAARLSAHAAVGQIIGDPLTAASTSDTRASAAKATLVAAHAAQTKAAAELGAHQTATGDLAERALEIAGREEIEAQKQFQASYVQSLREDLPVLLKLQRSELARHAQLKEAHSRWPEDRTLPDGTVLRRGAGLVSVGLPPGIFIPIDTPIGRRSAFEDDLLRTVAILYPALMDMLPQERVARVLAAVEAARSKGVTYFAGRADRWHLVENRGVDQAKLLTGRARREVRDLA
jgi:hypothetical protein